MQTDDLKKIMKLNRTEAFILIKEYCLDYLISLFKNINFENRKILLNNLKEYIKTLKEENKYYQFLLNNFSKIKNEKSFYNLLNELDILNKKTYLYFDSILREYEYNIEFKETKKIVPHKDFETILQRDDLKHQAISLTVSFYDLMQYFSKEDALYYLVPRTKFLNNADGFYGCYIKDEDSILKEIKLCLPPITDKDSLEKCIYLYELGILTHHHLNDEIPDKDYHLIASQEINKFKQKQLSKF